MCLLRDRWRRREPVPTGHTQEFKMQIKSITETHPLKDAGPRLFALLKPITALVIR